MKFNYLIAFLLVMSLGVAVAYSTYGSPTEFGNETNTTAWIGGDDGILNITGDAKIGGNTTSSWFFGYLNWSWLKNIPSYILSSNEGNLNVNSSDYWNNYNVASDLNNLITSSWNNLTDYPVACPAGTALTQLNDSVTCTQFAEYDFLNNNFNGSGTITSGSINISGIDTTGILNVPTINVNKGAINFLKVSNPDSTTCTATLNTDVGLLNATNVRYRITYVTATGETGFGSTSSYTNTVPVVAFQKVDLTNIPVSSDPNVISRKVYRTSKENNNLYYYPYIGEITNNVDTTWTDNVVLTSGSGGDTKITAINTAGGKMTGLSKVDFGTSVDDPANVNIYQGTINYDALPLIFQYGTSSVGIGVYTSPYNTILRFQGRYGTGTGDMWLQTVSEGNANSGILFRGAGNRGKLFSTNTYSMFLEANDQYSVNEGNIYLYSTPNNRGEVGIGFNNHVPTQKLEVNGSVNISGGNDLYVSDDLIIDGEITPTITATQSIGSSALRWLKGWFSSLDVSGNVNAYNFSINGTAGFTGSCVNITYSGGIAISCND